MALPKITSILLAAYALSGCSQVHTVSLSPNDPAYWYTEAPRYMPQVRAPGNERVYRPLGGAVY
jgi:hypothetical protein